MDIKNESVRAERGECDTFRKNLDKKKVLSNKYLNSKFR